MIGWKYKNKLTKLIQATHLYSKKINWWISFDSISTFQVTIEEFTCNINIYFMITERMCVIHSTIRSGIPSDIISIMLVLNLWKDGAKIIQ